MSPRKQAEKELKAAGFIKRRNGTNHDIWKDTESGQLIPLRRGSDFNENDLRIIRREIAAIKQGQR